MFRSKARVKATIASYVSGGEEFDARHSLARNPCAARRRRRAHPRAPRPPTPRRRPPSRSACRIWFVWTAFPRSRPPRTASGSPIRCAPPTSRRTRGGPPSGFSMSANGMRRRCVSRIWPPTRPRPNGASDGRFVYYLSNRSGSMQVWRAAPGGEPLQITNLPLDVGSFRVAPKSDRVLVSLEVYPDCASLDCTQAAAGCGRAPHGAWGVVRQDLRTALGRMERRPPLAAVRDRARRCGPRERDAGQSDRRVSTATCRASRSADGTTMPSARTADRWHSRCAQSRWANPGRPTSISIRSPRPAERRAIGRPTIRPGTASRPTRPTVRRSPTSPPTGPDSKPTAFIWCCSI